MSSDRFSPQFGDGGKDVAIRVRDVSKHYVMFERPEDRFKQMVVPRLHRLVGRKPRRYFTDFAALDNVSFEVARGETIGIVGRNGSGKSTLLQIVCGTLQPTAGAVEVHGRIAALLELGAGFNPEFTGRENVFLNAAILGVPRQEMEWRFDDIVRFADIGAFINQPVKTYSSGMYVRLAFAVAINVDPDILIVDEALSVGDEAFQRKCFARIEDIRDKGGTILFVSHGAQTIVELCDRAILFDRGEKILEGRPKTVVSQYQRLVNAGAETMSEIRVSILEMRDASAENEFGTKPMIDEFNDSSEDRQEEVNAPPGISAPEIDAELLVSNEKVALQVSLPAEAHTNQKVDEYFDPNLVTQSRIDHTPNGARILDVRITNLRDQPVNVIQGMHEYKFCYDVLFDDDAEEISFGIGLRTTSGFSLGGANLEGVRHERLKRCEMGTRVSAVFQFKCIFLPGTYFMNLAVIGERGDTRGYLARSVDAIIFKVAPQEASTAGGIIDFGIRISLGKADD